MNNKIPNKLPFGLIKSDLSYPKSWKTTKIVHNITLYEVTGIGWVVTTLGIGGTSRGAYAQRTYSVDENGKVWRVGKGPHVTQTLHVYVTNKREKALANLISLYTEGAVKANTIRDRISSRRAQGALNRMNGLSSWRW